MKRKTNRILFFPICLAILTSCGQGGTSTQSVQSHSNSSIVSDASVPSDSGTDSVTYVNTASGDAMLSCIFIGRQRITGYAVPGKYTEIFPSFEYLPKIDASKMYIDGNIPVYSSYAYSEDNPMSIIASNGEWDFFPTKVRYEKYTINNQPDRPEWTGYFRKKIDEVSPDTPVIIEGAFFFDWNGDGTQTVIVNAGNMFEAADSTGFMKDCSVPTTPLPPPSDKTAYYQMAAIFTYKQDKTEIYELLTIFSLLRD